MNNAPHIACDICGEAPVGEACYHICPNSVHFYSPAQERADDAFYGDDDIRERYAAERADLEMEAEYADDSWDRAECEAVAAAAIADSGGDDLPF